MSQAGRSSTARAVVAATAMTLFMLPSVARAAGDWPCTSTADCPAYSSTGQISDNSTCVAGGSLAFTRVVETSLALTMLVELFRCADPVNPEYGYCGYAGAPCGTDFDCDYGERALSACRVDDRPLNPLAVRLYRQMHGGQMLRVHGRQLRGATRLHGWVAYRR